MPLESSAYISELNPAWPLGTDGVNTSDDHHRNTKTAVQQSFPNISGPVVADQDDLNLLAGAAAGGSGLNPTGTVIMYFGAVAPDGYLAADGAAIDVQYVDLIALVGANTPDLQGQFIRGTSPDAAVDPDGPRVAGDSQADDNKAHTHGVFGSVNDGASTSFDRGNDAGTVTSQTTSVGTEARPKNVALLYCIKW
jgi:hypothetical protein